MIGLEVSVMAKDKTIGYKYNNNNIQVYEIYHHIIFHYTF